MSPSCIRSSANVRLPSRKPPVPVFVGNAPRRPPSLLSVSSSLFSPLHLPPHSRSCFRLYLSLASSRLENMSYSAYCPILFRTLISVRTDVRLRVPVWLTSFSSVGQIFPGYQDDISDDIFLQVDTSVYFRTQQPPLRLPSPPPSGHDLFSQSLLDDNRDDSVLDPPIPSVIPIRPVTPPHQTGPQRTFSLFIAPRPRPFHRARSRSLFLFALFCFCRDSRLAHAN